MGNSTNNVIKFHKILNACVNVLFSKEFSISVRMLSFDLLDKEYSVFYDMGWHCRELQILVNSKLISSSFQDLLTKCAVGSVAF